MPDGAEQRDEQRRLVLAVAEAPREDLRDLVGLNPWMPNSSPTYRVPVRTRSWMARTRSTRTRPRQARDGRARRLPQVVVGRELLLDEPPVPGAHLGPARVRADVQVRRDLGEPGIAGSGSIAATSRAANT
jgi:hypothetical protein